MSKMSLKSLGFLCVLGVSGLAAQGQPKPPECPVAAIDTAAWVLTKDPAIGIEMKHPTDYREIHWTSRSDTSGVSLAFRRNAANTIDINEFQGFYSTRGPQPSVPPCLLRTRSGELALHVEPTYTINSDGSHSPYLIGKAIISPTGKPRMLVEIGAPDSTALFEQMMMLRTIEFLGRPR